MSEMQIMQSNLARLMNHQQSLPELYDAEPADPFQKVHFGRKLRKSKLHASKAMPNSLPMGHNISSASNHAFSLMDAGSAFNQVSRHVQFESHPVQASMHEQNEEDVYLREIESLFRKLNNKIAGLQGFYKQRCAQLRRNDNMQSQQQLEQMIGYLQGSVQFIINDCLNVHSSDPLLHPERPQKVVHIRQEPIHSYFDSTNKQNMRNNNSNTHSTKRTKANSCQKGKQYHSNSVAEKSQYQSVGKTAEKSIYESVLEERQKRARKRIV